MPTLPRRTLASNATISGVTLFTAARTSLTIRPAPAGTGLVFRRIDLPNAPCIPALINRVITDERHTVLAADPAARGPTAPVVHTTEHILSALRGLGITDAALDLNGPEVPIADGSARPFTDAILAAGVAPLGPGRLPLAPIAAIEPIECADRGGASIRLDPPTDRADTSLTIEYTLDYGPNSPIQGQVSRLRIDHAAPSADYPRQIAPARTFCLLHEAQAMRKMGLFTHLGPADMLVIGTDGRPIDNTLRFEDEPARHKVLDIVGDLALTGRPVVGRITARRSGHALNQALCRALLAQVAAAAG